MANRVDLTTQYLSEADLVERWRLDPDKANRFLRHLRESGRIGFVKLGHSTVRYLANSVLEIEADGLVVPGKSLHVERNERGQLLRGSKLHTKPKANTGR